VPSGRVDGLFHLQDPEHQPPVLDGRVRGSTLTVRQIHKAHHVPLPTQVEVPQPDRNIQGRQSILRSLAAHSPARRFGITCWTSRRPHASIVSQCQARARRAAGIALVTHPLAQTVYFTSDVCSCMSDSGTVVSCASRGGDICRGCRECSAALGCSELEALSSILSHWTPPSPCCDLACVACQQTPDRGASDVRIAGGVAISFDL